MSPKKRVPLGILLVLGFVSLPMLLFGWQSPSREALEERIAASSPRWNSYQEDIKGQIGAAPVAEWSGTLVAATQSDDVLTLSFRLDEPWHSREAALPVLLEIPDGAILLPDNATRDTEHRLYHFALPASTPLAWAEVQYPHHRERIYLDADGQWAAKN